MCNLYPKTFLNVFTLSIVVLCLFTASDLTAQILFGEHQDSVGEFYKQDITRDGNVNIMDVVALLLLSRDDPCHPVADFTDDGEYDIQDVTSLMLSIMKGDLSLPGVFSIVGRVVEKDQGLPGVFMICEGPSGWFQNATNSDGYYRFDGLYDGRYKVKPVLKSYYYTFDTEELEAIINGDSITLPDIQATYAAFTLSGRIVEDGLGLEGVSVSVTGEGVDTVVVTDSLGMFRVDSLLNAPYSIVPSLENYTFDPYTWSVYMQGDSLIQDIKATPVGATTPDLHIIGGMVFCSVQPLSNVQVLLSGDMEAVTVTDAGGLYSFVVPDGNYIIIVVPIPLFQVFNPSSHSVEVRGQDIISLNFYGFGAGGSE